MKPKMALAWFFVSVALVALLVVQWRAAEKVKILNEKLQLQVEQLDKETKAAKASVSEAQKEVQSLRGEIGSLELDLGNTRSAYATALQRTNAPRATAAAQPSAARKEGAANPMSMMKQMLDDPEMAKVMKEQQKTMMNMMYGPLFKELGLTDEEAGQFKEMMLDRQMKAMDQVGNITDKDPEVRKAATEQAAAENKEFEEELKNFLGDDRYLKYQDYNTTIAERMTLNMYAQQSNIRPEQTQQLLDLMTQEKKAYQAQNPQASIDPNQDWQKLMASGETMERHFKQQEEINARIAEKAQQHLAPDQLKGFTEFMNNQLNMQRAGMKMAQKMMESGESPAPPQQPPVAEQPQ